MRIAIYQRWLATLGGGERYTLELAQALRDQGHSVTILTHQPIESDTIVQRLGLDIDGIAINTLPLDPAGDHVSAASRDYDWLINATHGTLINGQAAHNTVLTWFPLPLDGYDFGGSLASGRWDSSAIDHLFGVYAAESHDPWSWRWTGPRLEAVLRWRWPSTANAVRLDCAPIWSPDAPAPTVHVFANGQPIGTQSDWWTTWNLRLPKLKQRQWTIRLEITSPPPALANGGDSRHLGLPLAKIALQGPLGSFGQGGVIARPLQSNPVSRTAAQATLATYQSIWTISEFSADWVTQRWQRQSNILYPAVASIAPLHKQHHILSVGRFFTGAHNKKHGPMIEAFRTLCDQGLKDWEYHLVGGCDLEQPEQRAYLEALQERAKGYPIMFHVNAPLEELHRCYGQATIFWHAAGFEEDAETTPERMEHFGIATVEAMSAGCIPIVIDLAGQSEIVEHGQSGFRWNTLAELQHQTSHVIEHPERHQQLAHAAQTRAEHFNSTRFRERLAAMMPSDLIP